MNRAQCLRCGEVLESLHRHDFRTCSCGNLSVDGGEDYLKRSFGEYGYKELAGNEEE